MTEEKATKKRWVFIIAFMLIMIGSYVMGAMSQQPCTYEDKQFQKYYKNIENIMENTMEEQYYGTKINCYQQQNTVHCYSEIFVLQKDDVNSKQQGNITLKILLTLPS